MEKKILELIKNGEKINVEFKLAKDKLPQNIFESVCAFLNREGGYIILGVSDNRKIVGVNKEAINNLKKDFANLCNNSQKISPTIYLALNELKIGSKYILYGYVPDSSTVHQTNHKIFDRNEDGDYDITGNTNLIASMYIRKKKIHCENNIYPYATMDDLRSDLIERARIRAVNKTPNHPWGNMSDLELLKSASLYDKDSETGKEGINLAGILLFGKDETIRSALPYHRVDALYRVNDLDRYDDRDDIRTNLLDSFDRLMKFIEKHLPDPFYLENDVRISVREKIARELCANILIHREYSDAYTTRLIITKDEIYTENASIPKRTGYIDVNDFVPYSKNPILSKFFSEIGLADELGSGIKKMTKYVQIYSGGVPVFKDGDVFITKIPLNNVLVNNQVTLQATTEVTPQVTPQVTPYVEPTSKYEQIILDFCIIARASKEIQEYIGIKDKRYFMRSILNPLVEKGLINLTIPDKPRSSKQKYIKSNNC